MSNKFKIFILWSPFLEPIGTYFGDLRIGVGDTFNIFGGSFALDSTWQVISGSSGSAFNVYGYDLLLQDNLLTGFLADGSRLRVNIADYSGLGSFNLIQVPAVGVPEPGTLGLFGIGLSGLFFRRRKRN